MWLKGNTSEAAFKAELKLVNFLSSIKNDNIQL
jgi:hypothetical protein